MIVDEANIPQLHRPCDSAEQALLAQVAQGKQDALVTLYQRYQRPIFVYLLRLLRDKGLAEEILQDVVVAIWQGAATFSGRSRVSTWFFGIAHRQAVQAMRRRALPHVPLDEYAEVGDEEQDAERVTFALALQVDLEAALERLSPVHREALELVLAHGFSYEEAAMITDVPVGTVKSRVNHARRLMQQALKERGWREGASL
jgi:RNA polymerase sigma-70 factor (ECF subfamily)